MGLKISLLLLSALILGVILAFLYGRRAQFAHTNKLLSNSVAETEMYAESSSESIDPLVKTDVDDLDAAPSSSIVSLLLKHPDGKDSDIDFSSLRADDIEELFVVAKQAKDLEKKLDDKKDELSELKKTSRELVLDLVKARGIDNFPTRYGEESANEENYRKLIDHAGAERIIFEKKTETDADPSLKINLPDDEARPPQADQNNVLKAELDDKEKKIASLNQKIQKFRVLEASRARQDQQLRELRQKLSKALVFEQRLIAQNNEFVELKKKSATVDQLTAAVEEQEKRILHLKNAEQEAEKTKSEVEVKNRELAELHEQLAKTNKITSVLASQETELEHLRAQSERTTELERSILEKERKIETLLGESARAMELESALRETTQRHEARHNEVQSLRIKLENLKNLETQLKEKESELSRLRGTVRESSALSENEIAHLDHELAQERTKIAKYESALLEKERQIEEMQDEKNSFKKELDTTKILLLRAKNVVRKETGVTAKKKPSSRARKKKVNFSKRGSKKQNSQQKANPSKPTPKRKTTQNMKSGAVKAQFKAKATKDNLQQINGIGPVMEKLLNAEGIRTFKQLAQCKQSDIEKIEEAMDIFSGRIRRDNWVPQAKKFARK